MKLTDVEMQVHVEGSSLAEYDVHCDEAGKGIECYITSEAGKNFVLEGCNGSRNTAFIVVLFIDGVLSGRYIWKAGDKFQLAGLQIDQETLCPFMFSPLKLTDNDSVVTMPLGESKPEDIGTLRLELFRVTVLDVSKQPHQYTVPSVVDDNLVLHEKTKKAGAHRVQLGEKVSAKAAPPLEVYYIDWWLGAPYMSFTFRYRPKEMLQAQGIIPADKRPANVKRKRPGPEDAGPSKRTRTDGDPPVADSSDHKLESENEDEDEDLRALLVQRSALDARIRKVEKRAVKREPSPITLGVAKGALIDLTLD